MDPYTGQPVKNLLPIRGDVLNQKFFADQKWESWDIESWQDLVARSPAVLLSDDLQFTNNVQVGAEPQSQHDHVCSSLFFLPSSVSFLSLSWL